MVQTTNDKEVRTATAPNMKQPEQKKIEQPVQPTNQPQKTKFEIEVFQADYENSDANGNPIANWKRVNYDKPIIIEASCKKDLDDLAAQYAMCDQKFKIIRALNPPKPQLPPPPQAVQTQAVAQPSTQQVVMPQVAVSQQIVVQKPKPKIITIGDIQLKYDGDKVYQKQWIKINSSDSKNIRVVNDSTNKIVNLTGKHIEVKKWVLVEQQLDDAIEEIISDEE